MDEHLGESADGGKPTVIDKAAFDLLACFLQGTVELVNQRQGSTGRLVFVGNGLDVFKKVSAERSPKSCLSGRSAVFCSSLSGSRSRSR